MGGKCFVVRMRQISFEKAMVAACSDKVNLDTASELVNEKSPRSFTSFPLCMAHSKRAKVFWQPTLGSVLC